MKRVLLDTHVVLWLASAPDRLPPALLEQASDAATERVISAASTWEIAIKYELGKLSLPAPPEEFVLRLISQLALVVAPIELAHTLRAGRLPPLHRDPFDRMLVAQAQLLDIPIMTVDAKLARYDVEVIAG